VNKVISGYLATGVEPFPDSIYGDGYRCSAFLEDGTFLPCVMLRRAGPLVALAKKRLDEEKGGWGFFKSGNGYDAIIKTFVASGNRLNDYDIAKIEPSKYAIPMSLLKQIEGETTMGWTGFVFEMDDGALLALGTSFQVEFFNIPERYTFGNVVRVHNHSYVTKDGKLGSLREGMGTQPGDYDWSSVHRERPYFICYYDT
jgi:hypothetical protein